MNGAGHGSTVLGPQNTYWYFASMALSYNVNWERRLCMFPLFDRDGLMGQTPRMATIHILLRRNPGKRVNFPDGCCFRIKNPLKSLLLLKIIRRKC